MELSRIRAEVQSLWEELHASIHDRQNLNIAIELYYVDGIMEGLCASSIHNRQNSNIAVGTSLF